MKNFIKQIFGTNAESKNNSLNSWLDELEGLDDASALQFSTQHLTQLNNPIEGADRLSLKSQYDLIIMLEELNHHRLEKLSTQFSSLENLKPELENSLCETAYAYCRQAFVFQLKVIEQLVEQTKSVQQTSSQAEQVTFLLARTINSAFNMIKWRLFSQANPPTKVWLQINVLYRLSTQRALLNNTLELFNFDTNTSLSACFVQIYMLGQLAQSSMKKSQLEIASRVIKTLLTRARISDKSTPEQYLFYVDLQKDLPAKRMREVALSDSCRYWELDDLEKQISVAITVSDRGEMPLNLTLAKIDSPKKLNETLRLLLEEWKKIGYVRQRRKFDRYASSKTARVKAGIADICNQVKLANQLAGGLHQGASLDERLRLHTTLKATTSLLTATSGTLDTWMITDESAHGLGARVNKYANILARPNKLIGLMIDGEMNKIVIGMIRSVKPTQGNQLRVGVEILSNHPQWLQLKRSDKSEAFPNSQFEKQQPELLNTSKPSSLDINTFSGIYLPIEAGLSDASQLILPKMNYRANDNYGISMAGVVHRVLLGEPIEAYDDWVKVAFPF
jgi:hypothetical protein